MIAAGKLPSGFAVGTAKGTFVSVEAPSMGDLPIRATVIHLTEGPTDSWAAVFTSNKVGLLNFVCAIILQFASTNTQLIFYIFILVSRMSRQGWKVSHVIWQSPPGNRH
jgi:hypothetical protein